MPVLDAEALKSDARGLAFLRAVLGQKRPKRTPSWQSPSPRPQTAEKPAPDTLPR
jgi:hypothetical protein